MNEPEEVDQSLVLLEVTLEVLDGYIGDDEITNEQFLAFAYLYEPCIRRIEGILDDILKARGRSYKGRWDNWETDASLYKLIGITPKGIEFFKEAHDRDRYGYDQSPSDTQLFPISALTDPSWLGKEKQYYEERKKEEEEIKRLAEKKQKEAERQKRVQQKEIDKEERRKTYLALKKEFEGKV